MAKSGKKKRQRNLYFGNSQDDQRAWGQLIELEQAGVNAPALFKLMLLQIRSGNLVLEQDPMRLVATEYRDADLSAFMDEIRGAMARGAAFGPITQADTLEEDDHVTSAFLEFDD